jgi:SAM-dependent methyltransferase
VTETEAKRGFQVGGQPGDLFKGTAPYYEAYRQPYPSLVVDHLVERCGLDGQGRLLDAGCGTGQVFQVVARHFNEVLAIDPDPDMVACARRKATDLGLNNVTVHPMRAEDLDANDGPLRMAIFGASFHWTDRPRVAEVIYDLLEPGGCLALLCSGTSESKPSDWQIAIQDVVKHHLGPERRAGGGVYREGERHEALLGRTRFKSIEVTNIPAREESTINQIVGHLYSTSFASKNVLGVRAPAFEQDVRQRLMHLRPDGQFEKAVVHTVILAER